MDHIVGARKKDLERIADPKIAAINPTELFANTKLVDIFPKPKNIVTVNENDKVVDAMIMMGKNTILSVPVYSKTSRGYNKFLDVLDVVSYIHQSMVEKKIDDKQAAKMERDELFKAIGFSDVTVSKVANFNVRNNYYLFEGRAPARAVLDRIVQSNLHRVPILDGEGELYGICSQTDLILFIHMHSRLFSDFENKTVKDLGIGFQKVHTIKNTENMMNAFNLIHEKHISGVGVVDEKGALVGAISGSDVKLIGLDSNIHKLFIPYTEISSETKEVIHVVPEDKFLDVVEKMVTNHIHRVFILDPQTKTPVGVLSQIDVLRAIHSSLGK